MGEGKAPKIALVLAHKEPDEDDEDTDAEASDDEVDAVKAFDAAKGPKERAKALKAFIKLCSEEY